MDIQRLFQDYSIRRAHEGEKHYRLGWYNIPCPFCTGHSGNHLGYNVDQNYFKCWRCGHKPTSKVLSKILGISFSQSKTLIRQYKGKSRRKVQTQTTVKRIKFFMPDDSESILNSPVAMEYLRGERGFSRMDSIWVAKRFHLQATGCMGFLNDLDLSYRIIAPIFHEGNVVSFQSRDFTDAAFLRYITCPAIIEKMEHKKVLYNAPDPETTPVIVLCEGIIDVWKVILAGFPATCCFGVEYTPDQFLLLKKYQKIIIFLDPDKAGTASAKKLQRQMIFAGRDADIIINKTGKDPGDLNKRQIRKIITPFMKSA